MSIIAAYAVPHPPLIVPSVGRGEEKGIQDTIDAYEEIARRTAAHKPDCIVVSSPHAPLYYDYLHIASGDGFHGSLARFRVPRETLFAPYDHEFIEQLCRVCADENIPAGTEGARPDDLDHASFVPLYFISKELDLSTMPIVRVGLSGMDGDVHRAFGRAIAKVADLLDRRTVYIASGDLSHKLKTDGPYGFAEEGPVFDEQITEAFAANDLEAIFHFDPALCDGAAECGLRSFQIMAGALDGQKWNSELLSYEGPFGVGYGVAAFELADSAAGSDAPSDTAAETATDTDPYVRLARLSFDTFTRTGHRATLSEAEERLGALPKEMLETAAGAFVSLHEHGDLRGCIGTIAATQSCVAEEILRNAICACSEDPRFDPIRPDELSDIVCSVDVLGPAEPISSLDQLDVKRYGVIVTRGYRRGLLLPDLEGVDTPQQQVDIARRKAGIGSREEVQLERFEVIRHE